MKELSARRQTGLRPVPDSVGLIPRGALSVADGPVFDHGSTTMTGYAETALDLAHGDDRIHVFVEGPDVRGLDRLPLLPTAKVDYCTLKGSV